MECVECVGSVGFGSGLDRVGMGVVEGCGFILRERWKVAVLLYVGRYILFMGVRVGFVYGGEFVHVVFLV